MAGFGQSGGGMGWPLRANEVGGCLNCDLGGNRDLGGFRGLTAVAGVV